MSAPAETTAAMTPPAEFHGTAATEPSTPTDPAQPASAADPSQSGAGRGAPRSSGHQRRTVSPNVIISLLGGLLTALLMWQFNTLGNSIDSLGTGLRAEIGSLGTELRTELRSEVGSVRTEIGSLGTELRTELRSEIGSVRAEMQAGFREINATLLDHTDRLARLEAAAGLPRADGSSTVAPAADDVDE